MHHAVVQVALHTPSPRRGDISLAPRSVGAASPQPTATHRDGSAVSTPNPRDSRSHAAPPAVGHRTPQKKANRAKTTRKRAFFLSLQPKNHSFQSKSHSPRAKNHAAQSHIYSTHPKPHADKRASHAVQRQIHATQPAHRAVQLLNHRSICSRQRVATPISHPRPKSTSRSAKPDHHGTRKVDATCRSYLSTDIKHHR